MWQNFLRAFVAFLTSIAAFFTPATEPVDFSLTNVNPNPIKQEVMAQELTVMSYNLKYNGKDELSRENRKDDVCRVIASYSPDSFGVQEAEKPWVDLISEAMPEYAHYGRFRDDGLEQGESSTIFYKRDKYDLIDSGDFWLSKTPNVPSKDWEASWNRICTYVVLKDKETGFTYAHFNTHFDNSSEIAKTESVAIVSQKIAEIAPDIPVVFMGDLNFNETSGDYDNLVACGLQNTKYLTEDYDVGGTYNGFNVFAQLDFLPIDHIFVNAYVKNVNWSRIDDSKFSKNYPSDHFPVIVNMTMFNG